MPPMPIAGPGMFARTPMAGQRPLVPGAVPPSAPGGLQIVDPAALQVQPMAIPRIDTAPLPDAHRTFFQRIGDGIKMGLSDPDTRAALLRSGLATLATGNIGAGGLEGAKFMDERRQQRAAQAAAQAKLALEARGQDTKDFEAQNNAGIGWSNAGTNRENATTNARGVEYGHSDRVLGIRTTAATAASAQAHENARFAAGQAGADRRTGMTIAGLNRRAQMGGDGGSRRLSPTDSERLYRQTLPGILGSMPSLRGDPYKRSDGTALTDYETAAAALEANPQLSAAMRDAVRGSDGTSAGALRAMSGILSNYGYNHYKSGGWLGSDQQPGFFPKAAPARPAPARAMPASAGQPAEKVIGGRAYRNVNGQWFDTGPVS